MIGKNGNEEAVSQNNLFPVPRLPKFWGNKYNTLREIRITFYKNDSVKEQAQLSNTMTSQHNSIRD